MAKPIVERAPAFNISEVDYANIEKYLDKYNATDDQGHYLHWNVLKWRVPKAEAKNIRSVIKFQRTMQMKYISLSCVKGVSNSYGIAENTARGYLNKLV